MILTGDEIKKELEYGRLVIEPFCDAQLNPNSYNVTLGDELLVYENYVLDAKLENKTRSIMLSDCGYTLNSGLVYLAHTTEVIGSDCFVPIIKGRSSIGRLGLFINITSDLVDIGSVRQLTLQLHAVQPVTIYPGMQIGQVTFWKSIGSIVKYSGKYKDNIYGPIPSKMFMDFQE